MAANVLRRDKGGVQQPPGPTMHRFVTLVLLVVAAIHLLPAVGVPGPERLSALYGIGVSDPNLELLLRHRAVLFAVFGGVMLAGAFHDPLRLAALLVGTVSVASFLALARALGPLNAPLDRVVLADGLALVLLVGALLAHWRAPGAG